MTKIRFSLREIDIGESICEFLNANIDEIHPALTFSEQDRNERVQIHEVSVNRVTIHDDGKLEIEYEYDWSYFAGCKDMNDGGVGQDVLEARLVGGVLEINVPERQEPRSTADEF